LRLLHDTLGNNVIGVTLEAGLLARQLLELALGGLGALALKVAPPVGMDAALSFHLLAAKGFPVAVGGQVDNPQVHAQHIVNQGRRRVFNVAGSEKVELATGQDKVTLALPGFEQSKLSLAGRVGDAAPVAERWTCCVCGQAFGEDVAVGLALLDGDEHPRAGAFLCEACLRDTAAGGAALGVEGLAAAAHFVMQQGEWQPDTCAIGGVCVLCGQKHKGWTAAGWTLREMPAGRAHDIQLCPACVSAGKSHKVTAWSPNGKNPHLAHHWTYQTDGSWSSACGQVQPVPWRPEADTSKHCASCARIVKAETG